MHRRVEFCEWATEKCNADDSFLNYLCMSDECTFTLHGKVNTQNFRYWAKQNPHWMAQTHTQRPQKVNVWAGLCRGQIIGPFFLPPTLDGESYLDLLVNRVGPRLAEIAGDVEDLLWYQQDGAPAHYSRAVREYLDMSFPDTWIGRRGPQEWPPRSPDLSQLDFFYWGYLKSKVYNDRPNDVAELCQRIIDVSAAITPEMLANVQQAWYHRLHYCLEVNGAHFEQFL